MAPRLVHSFSRFFANVRTCISLRRQSPRLVFHTYAVAVGRTRRASSTFPGALALSSLAGNHLPHRIHLPLDPDHRFGRTKRHLARPIHHGKSAPPDHGSKHRPRALPFVSNPLL